MTTRLETDRTGAVHDIVIQEGLFPGPSLTERGRELLVLHESAHAVLLTLDGGTVVSVVADPDATVGGCSGRGWTAGATLAGIAVERVEGSPLPHPAAMSKADLRAAGWGPDLRSYRRIRGDVRRLRADLQHTEDRVREHMPVIRRMADALQERGRLAGEDVRVLVEDGR